MKKKIGFVKLNSFLADSNTKKTPISSTYTFNHLIDCFTLTEKVYGCTYDHGRRFDTALHRW
jgi:hypothetical protein